ncbi:hypothetical protein [Serratia marcescens]|uniref:hypothetical protein n=1 Tax=Serratia marcescens TaxID=615 RepID=UPI001C8B2F08|nr:hypothetical protein [Serratia marcescens]
MHVNIQKSPFAGLVVPEHIRRLHVTWLKVIRWYHLCSEQLGIDTIGQMIDADEDDLRLLFVDDNDAAYLSNAINALIAEHPEPFYCSWMRTPPLSLAGSGDILVQDNPPHRDHNVAGSGKIKFR